MNNHIIQKKYIGTTHWGKKKNMVDYFKFVRNSDELKGINFCYER